MANQTEERFFDRDKYGFDYRGTLDLNFDIFPEVSSPQWMIDKGLAEEGDVSNIITGYYEVDDKYILMPGMMRGVSLTSDKIHDLIKEGKHFGIYDTEEDLDKADVLIHEWFKQLKSKEKVNMKVEDKIMDLLKEGE